MRTDGIPSGYKEEQADPAAAGRQALREGPQSPGGAWRIFSPSGELALFTRGVSLAYVMATITTRARWAHSEVKGGGPEHKHCDQTASRSDHRDGYQVTHRISASSTETLDQGMSHSPNGARRAAGDFPT